MRHPAWRSALEGSQAEACLAIELHNRPEAPRSFEAFVVHMHLAWLYLLQAVCKRDSVDYRYFKQAGKSRRYEYVDGEAKTWDLAKHVRYRWSETQDPTRRNLELFIGLRNKIEHRFNGKQEAIALATASHTQALLLNYDEELRSQFGDRWSMATQLRFPLFIGSFSDEGVAALEKLRKALPADLRNYIADFESSLPTEVFNDRRFQFKLRLEQVAVGSKDALALQFIRWSDLSDTDKEAYDQEGKAGRVILKQKIQTVANHDRLKPKQAARYVEDRIQFKFNMFDFKCCYLKMKVRPPAGSEHPEDTNADYCVYDSIHNDYSYEPRYCDRLVHLCSTAEGFRQTTGRAPRTKVAREASAVA
ncbi:MAG TPA: DUF3644 domain-containing protein [Candidatus Saccharimonadales bacterium]|nr:DUF3644 domain-containing protein [Candidatus Saccharimonadales bacterium]